MGGLAAAAGCLAAAGALLVAGAGSAGAAAVAPPHIVAKPSKLKAGAATHLTGTGFTARHLIKLEECSSRQWSIMNPNPCVPGSAKFVLTGAAGGFTTKFTVSGCAPIPAPGTQTCYVGVPTEVGTAGDDFELAGAVTITVKP